MGSRKTDAAAAVKTASDKQRCGSSQMQIDWRSICTFMNDATWLADLRQPGKMPIDTIDTQARLTRGWISSRSQSCTSDMGGPDLARWMRDRGLDAASTTRPASRFFAMSPGLEGGVWLMSSRSNHAVRKLGTGLHQ
ncbi:MAG: hypothetical protein KJ587_14695 [Alphaproteobacteria bacterium]|nr:hypothetical protein [Alphaproteobacteria bacterium]